jgi:hypothetical protein
MQRLQAMQQQPPQPSPEERIAQQRIAAELEREKLKQEGKLTDISSRERSKAAEIQEESRASSERVRSREDLAILEAELKMMEER